MNINRWHIIIIFITFCLVILFLDLTIYSVSSDAQEKDSEAIEEVINKALLQCYALEGAYPSDIYYLNNNYGIILNEEDYFYYYEAYGANLFPQVVVIKK